MSGAVCDGGLGEVSEGLSGRGWDGCGVWGGWIREFEGWGGMWDGLGWEGYGGMRCDGVGTVETEHKVTQSALDVHMGCTPFVKD